MRCFAPALRLLVLLTLPLVLNLAAANTGLAVERAGTASSEDVARLEKRIDDLENKLKNYKALEQERRGTDEKVVAERMAGVNKRIDDGLDRIGDVSTHVTLFTAFITVLLFGIGIFAYFGAGKQARKEAKEWLKDNRKKHDDELKKWIDECKVEFEKSINELAKKLEARIDQKVQHADNKLQCFDDDLKGLLEKAQQSMGKGRGPLLSDQDKNILDGAATKIKDTDESNLTYFDWNVKAYDAYEKGNYEEAVICFEKVAEDNEAPESERATAILNKGITLSQHGDTKGALYACEDVLLRFGDSHDPAVQAQIARALVNKGVALRDQGKTINSLAAYEEVLRRFGDSQKSALQAQVARALVGKGGGLGTQGDLNSALSAYEEVIHRHGNSLESGLQGPLAMTYNGLGFTHLMLAKENWFDLAKRKDCLNNALINLEKSLPHLNMEGRPSALFNLAYALFLLGRHDEAKPVLLRTLQEGGQKLYDGELEDSRQHSVPEDDAFRALLNELWAQVQPTLPAAMGGTADDKGKSQADENGGDDKGKSQTDENGGDGKTPGGKG